MTAIVRPVKTAAETALVQQFAALKATLPGNRKARENAFASVVEGLPHRRVEEWKYTDLRALMKDAKPLAEMPGTAEIEAAKRASLARDGAVTALFVNGALAELGTLPGGIEAVPLAKAFADNHPLLARFGEAGAPMDNAAIALNTAFVSDGLLLTVKKGENVSTPIHLAFVQEGTDHAAYARVLIVVEEGASFTLIESHAGHGTHQTNSYVELLAADKTDVTAIKLQAESSESQHLATFAIKLGAEAKLTTVAFVRGGAVARQQVFLKFDGEGSTASLNGVTLSGGDRHLDTTLFVDHAAFGCESRELFKSVLDGESRSVFQGKILVRQNAQKTDGRMMMRALMLSEGCEADMKPELEIYADDVQCAHGATCGALDADHLFYLMARGIPKVDAEAILAEGFVGEVLDMVEDERVHAALSDVAAQWLRRRDWGKADPRA
jgi:Fe-S cluster assembly protein SufD